MIHIIFCGITLCVNLNINFHQIKLGEFMYTFDNFVYLNEQQKDEFYDLIQKQRGKISNPKKLVDKVWDENRDQIIYFINEKRLSEAIIYIREEAYKNYLIEEKIFNANVLKELPIKIELASNYLNNAVDELIKTDVKNPDYKKLVSEIFGDYAGSIYPYIYELSLSSTNSRRSRSGKTFEHIIYSLYDFYRYPFDSQSKIGKTAFSSLGLGKVVDSILPSVDAFEKLRNKTIVGSMKTSLRERWQEVVEEVTRSNLPNIFLLTLDDLTLNKIIQMAQHNIVVVVPINVKTNFPTSRNVISFEEYFNHEIPDVLKYWSRTTND